MSSKIFESIVAELIFVNQSYQLEALKQDAGVRLYNLFRNNLLETFPELVPNEGKLVDVFYRKDKNILSIEKQKEAIKIVLNAKFGTIKDSECLFRDVSKVGHWGYGEYQAKLTNTDKFSYVINLVRQLY